MTMGLQKPSAELSERVIALEKFQAEYHRLLELTEVRQHGPFASREVRDGCDSDFSLQRSKVAELAGPAVAAAQGFGVSVRHYEIEYEPLSQWSTALREDSAAEVEVVQDATSFALGRIRVALDRQLADERTWAFRIGWFVGLPWRAREAAGNNGARASIAFWGSVAAQVLGSLGALAIVAVLGLIVRVLA